MKYGKPSTRPPIESLMYRPVMPSAVTAVNLEQGQGGGRRAKKVTVMEAQASGFALAPIIAAGAAIYAGLSKFQPFSKAKRALEDNIGQGKDSMAYKVGHKIASIGSSIGYGAKKKKAKSRKHKCVRCK